MLIEALKGNYPINKVLISSTKRDRKIDAIIHLCRQGKVLFQMVPQATINRKAGPDNQGVFAEISPVRFYTLEEVLEDIQAGLILILDSINDTGNMGAIIRSAVAAGVDGIIVSQRNSAPINETVLKTSAGSVLTARIVQSKNLRHDIDVLKRKDFWIVGADMKGDTTYYEYDFKYKTAVLLGSENRGISLLLKKSVDHLIAIPHSPKIESLNVAAAAAVILFEALRQKKASTG